jgi:phage terminase large subunit-like protein
VAVSKSPLKANTLAVREVMAWEAKGVPRDFEQIQDDIKNFCLTWNVQKIVYDPMQLVQMSQHLSKPSKTESGKPFSGVQTEEFKQGVDRTASDKQLLDLIVARYIAHSRHPLLRKHLDNADKKLDKNGNLRIVKRLESLKIDLAVCLSMATAAVGELVEVTVTDRERQLFGGMAAHRGV